MKPVSLDMSQGFVRCFKDAMSSFFLFFYKQDNRRNGWQSNGI